MSREPAACLDAYRGSYALDGSQAPLDAGVRAADAHVEAHDPLRGVVSHDAWPGVVADVALGVEPGTYFCGGLAHALAARGGARVGFIHVPPDAVLPRPALLDLLGEVVSGVLAALEVQRPVARVLLTGFGPFPGVPDNPTAAFAGDGSRTAAACAGRPHLAVVLRLAALDGTAYEAMAPVLAQLEAAIATSRPDVVLALGVDSRQALARPRFTLETQSRGMRELIAGRACEPPARALPLDDVPLAVLRAGAFRRR